jgi:hypothetical protein
LFDDVGDKRLHFLIFTLLHHPFKNPNDFKLSDSVMQAC